MAGLEELKKKLAPLFDAEKGFSAGSTLDPSDSYMLSDGGTVNLLSRSYGVYNFNELGLQKCTSWLADESDHSEKTYRCASHEMRIFGAIGSGASSVVQRAVHIPTHRIIALKKINIFEKEKRNQLLTEIRTLCEAPCNEGLVEFHGAFYMPDSGQISIALEYMDGGSLADILRMQKSIPEPILSSMFKKLLQCATFVGTVTYMSPERIRNESYSYPADIWSIGLALFECGTGEFPYAANEGPVNLMLQILEDPSPSPSRQKFSPEFCSFVDDCLKKDAEARPTAEQLLSHPFITKYEHAKVDLAAFVRSVFDPMQRMKDLADMLAIHYYLLFDGPDELWQHLKILYDEGSTLRFSGKHFVGPNDIFATLTNIRRTLAGDWPPEKLIHVVEKLHCRAHGEDGIAIRASGSFMIGNQFLICGDGVQVEGLPNFKDLSIDFCILLAPVNILEFNVPSANAVNLYKKTFTQTSTSVCMHVISLYLHARIGEVISACLFTRAYGEGNAVIRNIWFDRFMEPGKAVQWIYLRRCQWIFSCSMGLHMRVHGFVNGYEFFSRSYGVVKGIYEDVIEILSSLKLDKAIQDLCGSSRQCYFISHLEAFNQNDTACGANDKASGQKKTIVASATSSAISTPSTGI
ncbi:mitogen-activated protein kinase kinase 3 [Citrus sinensis]|uniref:Mitogen-activated protein kinase kinase 3 n=1 Tax=Citrus sinensis TaxID=2711 RepID=A0ACB8MYJ6_CITSI|nr:mitogen-activated protein kinase kinase 3 [Citrus sinensis]